MKQVLLVVMIVIMGGCHSLSVTRNVEKMREQKREKYLVRVADETVLRHFPEHYQSSKPLIISDTVRSGTNVGKLVYVVCYSKDVNDASRGCGVKVYIRPETGLANNIVTSEWGRNLIMWREEMQNPENRAILRESNKALKQAMKENKR